MGVLADAICDGEKMMRKSKILQVVHETARDLNKSGVLSDEALRQIEDVQQLPKPGASRQKKAPDRSR